MKINNIDYKNESSSFFSAGFTFVEIMIVVSLMSLIVGITVIYFANSMSGAKLKATARDLSAAIRYTRHLAHAKNERKTINIDLSNKNYAIDGQTPKKIADDMLITIYEQGANAAPIKDGKYSISYDVTGASAWNSIVLSMGEKTVKIIMDPLLTAVVEEDKKNDHNK